MQSHHGLIFPLLKQRLERLGVSVSRAETGRLRGGGASSVVSPSFFLLRFSLSLSLGQRFPIRRCCSSLSARLLLQANAASSSGLLSACRTASPASCLQRCCSSGITRAASSLQSASSSSSGSSSLGGGAHRAHSTSSSVLFRLLCSAAYCRCERNEVLQRRLII